MIIGIGTDCSRASRLRSSIERDGRFVDRVFTENEKAYCLSKKDPWPHFAVRFAAKEAAMKAWGKAIPPRDIEVTVGENQRPCIRFHGKMSEEAKRHRIASHISLSHEDDHAMAVVLLEC